MVSFVRGEWLVVLLAVAFGGALGALCRYLVAIWVAGFLGTLFPWGTLLINLSGSFALGLLYTLSLQAAPSSMLRPLVATGFLGAYTTFSTFCMEAINLMRDGEYHRAALYVLASVLLGLAGAWAGMTLAQLMIKRGFQGV